MKINAIILTSTLLGTWVGHSAPSPETSRPRNLALLQQNIFPDAEWQKSRPEDQGVDSAKLAEALKFLGTKGQTTETAIVRNGYLIHAGKNATKAHGVWSCSKSFTSAVAGLLVEDGKISLDTFAKDINSDLKSQYPLVQLKHFATMTSGYDAKGGGYGPGGEDGSKTPFSVSKPVFQPGSHYAYWDDAMRMYGAVLTMAAKKTLKDVFNERIAKKIGLKRWNWSVRGKYKGYSVMDSAGGISIDAVNMARYCYLFLNRGKWKGTQVLSEDWVEAATTNQVPADTPVHKKSQNWIAVGSYGYNWWTNSEGKLYPDAPKSAFAALGAKGNMCLVVPEWNMVLVRLGTKESLSTKVQNDFLKLVGQSLTK